MGGWSAFRSPRCLTLPPSDERTQLAWRSSRTDHPAAPDQWRCRVGKCPNGLQMIEWPGRHTKSFRHCDVIVVVAPFGGGLPTLLHLHVLADVRTLLADQQFDSETVDVGRVSCH